MNLLTVSPSLSCPGLASHMACLDDILRARFNTNGVCEYKFQFRNANHCTRHCVIYDVGGARTQRAVWQSYFDDADAIIFLASLSAFDQTLVEDPTMNRMVCRPWFSCLERIAFNHFPGEFRKIQCSSSEVSAAPGSSLELISSSF